jgi:hypothetical protein
MFHVKHFKQSIWQEGLRLYHNIQHPAIPETCSTNEYMFLC